MNETQTRMVYVFDVLDRGEWIPQPGRFDTFLAAQAAAIENGRRPYRIKKVVA